MIGAQIIFVYVLVFKMSHIKLYKDDIAPPSRAAMMVAAELGLNVTLVDTPLFQGAHLSSEYLKKNPLHSVPSMEDGDFWLSDSHAIAGYLASVYGEDDSLYPDDPKKRAVIHQRMHFDDAILYVRTRNITYPVLVLGKTEVSQDKYDLIEEALGYLESYLNMNEWLAGDQLTIADFCAVATLTATDAVLPLDKNKHPKTIAWWNKLAQRPSYKQYCEPGAQRLAEIFKAVNLTII